MAPSRSIPSSFTRKAEVIDLVSSDEEKEAPPSHATMASGKRNRDASSPKSDRATKKTSSSKKTSCQSTGICMPFINGDVLDYAVCTTEIMPLLHRLNRANIITCSGRDTSTPTTTSSLLHIRQPDKWSCGFRNLQMIMTALLPLLPQNHKFFSSVPSSLGPYPPQEHNRPVPIPSLHQLQTFLENSWKHGFDERGAQHYKRRIVGKSALIGAIEVSTILSYLHLDSAVIQFIKIPESRGLLGPFVWQYFSQGPCLTCGRSSASVSSWSSAERLLLLASHANCKSDKSSTSSMNQDSCSCPILPLYLQWEGHSVCIVGVEMTASGDLDLLLFDPMKCGEALKESLESSSRKDVLAPMRKSVKSLLNRDVQLVMCLPRELPELERNVIRDPYKEGNIVTAAEHAVAQFRQQQQQRY